MECNPVTINLPCNIDDKIYVVEDYNQYYDQCAFYETQYGEKAVIREYIVEAFIIDKNGVFIAEDGHDGFNKITTYHNLTTEEYGDCKIFFSRDEACKYVKSISK